MKNLEKIDNILQKNLLELPYFFQKYLINDLIELGNIREEDLEVFIITIGKLFIELANGSTCLKLEDNSSFINFISKYPDIINYEKSPLILRKIDSIFFLYRQKDYVDEIQLENILKKRMENNKIGNNLLIEINDENIKKALIYNNIFITGGPGSGKTTLATEIYKNFYNAYMKNNNKTPEIKIAAPTGKAAKVLADRIGKNIEGFTIHKLLEYSPTYDKFKYHKDFKLKADMIIIDEASMIDLRLFKNLLEAIEDSTRLIVIGDKDQLPSVDSGAVFRDIIEANIFEEQVIKLTTQHRSNEKISLIAKKINNEENNVFELLERIEISDFKNKLEKNEQNVYFIELNEQISLMRIIDSIVNYYKNNIDNSKILSITNRGFLGVDNINKIIIEKYKDIIKNIPIMVTENDYENNVFNGDIGILDNNYIVKFPDNFQINLNLLKNWKYAFAITIHKSQGSDYNDIFLILPEKKENPLLTKNLLYTGITRARNRVFIIGKKEVFMEGINKESERYSGIKFIRKS